MTRIFSVGVIITVVALVVWGVITFYDETLQVGRMWETPAVKPHEEPIPVMASHSIPFNGGEAFYRFADPKTIESPIALNDPQTIANGQKGYVYFCIQCHGKYHDGNGTVGQSFAPLPGDIRSAKVQTMPAGQLFHEISYGIPGGRQPALATTISIDERWQIIGFVRSLGVRP